MFGLKKSEMKLQYLYHFSYLFFFQSKFSHLNFCLFLGYAKGSLLVGLQDRIYWQRLNMGQLHARQVPTSVLVPMLS